MEPQETDSRWFPVPKGYIVSGTYSVSDNNPVELTVYYGALLWPTNVISEESSSGSFQFKATGYAPEDKYYLSLKNPASSGFFGLGAGPTVTITVEFKVSGYTTFL